MSAREPILNIPPVVVAVLAVIGTVHAVLWGLLSPARVDDILTLFAFIPARYDSTPVFGIFPGGLGAEIWTFVTYAFLHADLNHVVFNSVWLLAFGSAVARRFGAVRFLLFFAVTAAAGAALHLATHAGELYPVIGASGAISGCMAAAMRFMFHGHGPLGILGNRSNELYRIPAQSLRENLSDRRVLIFLAVWFGTNLVVGLLGVGLGSPDQTVAWEAHIGGFLAGLIAFPLFDPVPAYRAPLPEPGRPDVAE